VQDYVKPGVVFLCPLEGNKAGAENSLQDAPDVDEVVKRSPLARSPSIPLRVARVTEKKREGVKFFLERGG
jgi:hypothetical protein